MNRTNNGFEYDATDYQKVYENRENILLKAILSLPYLLKQIELLLNMVSDYFEARYQQVPLSTILSVCFALVYFLSPIDLIPDFLLIIGYTDDFIVLSKVWESIKLDLKNYLLWKKGNPRDYGL
ncbi:MAG: YkvA family protein [Candidatus Nealsonbacteria bacterium]|nr:YkvA family protein [Candidatus Nealsonbacteria bacterium]